MTSVKVGRYTVAITNPDRVLFGKSGITKGQMIDYYRAIAPTMLPHMKNKLVTMQRFVKGINHEGFFQKDAGDYFPPWITTQAVARQSGGSVDYVVVNNAATLVYLANQDCITFHTWLSRRDKLEYPDRMIFDLDPSGKDFATVRNLALQLGDILKTVGCTPYVMTTGSRGLHVLVPITRTVNFDGVSACAYAIAQLLVKRNLTKATLEVRKIKRKGKVFIDTLRNQYGATAVAPYAVRPIAGAPVATPLRWSEVGNKSLTSQQYTIKTIFTRLARIPDPLETMHEHSVSVHAINRKFKQLYSHELSE